MSLRLQRDAAFMNDMIKRFPSTMASKGLALFSLMAALCVGGGRLQASTVDINPGANIPTVVSNNPAGTTFVIHPGLYRLQVPIPAKNNDVFEGQSGAILDGSRLLTSFQFNGTYYYVNNQTQKGQIATGNVCQTGYPTCVYPEELYFDNARLVRATALSGVGPGKWYFDYADHVIWLYDNPSGHTVETSVTPSAFTQGPANNVTIEGLTIQKFAVPIMCGAITGANTGYGSPTTGVNWVVQNNVIQQNHGNGVRPNFGWRVLNNHILSNGALGIGGGIGGGNADGSGSLSSGLLIQGNEVAYNGYAHVNYGFGNGGIKSTRTYGEVVRGNNIHDNIGNGFHLDGKSTGLLFDNNTVADNINNGINHEISSGGTFRNNRLLRNGYVYPNGTSWLYGADLLSSESQNVQAYCNTVEVSAQGGNGIDIIAQNRPDGNGPSSGNYFHHNTVVFDGISGWTGGAEDDPAQDPNFFTLNRFDYNAYHQPDLTQHTFSWNNRHYTFAQLQTYGPDAHGSADTNYTGSVPTVAISSPADGLTVSGIPNVTGTAQADLTSVQLYVDWVLDETEYTSPFSFPFYSTSLSNGPHTVAVVAADGEGMRSCYAVTLNVHN